MRIRVLPLHPFADENLHAGVDRVAGRAAIADDLSYVVEGVCYRTVDRISERKIDVVLAHLESEQHFIELLVG